MNRTLLATAGFFGASGVVLGALGAHALSDQMQHSLSTWQTAVQYHLIHALALLVLAFQEGNLRYRSVAAGLFIAGLVGFSGSLYVLALGGPPVLGPVTPLGGLAFIAGWCVLIASALSRRR